MTASQKSGATRMRRTPAVIVSRYPRSTAWLMSCGALALILQVSVDGLQSVAAIGLNALLARR